MQGGTIVDGQQMFLLRDEEWNSALEYGTWGELPLYSPSLNHITRSKLKFARSHPSEFRLALCRDSPFRKTWTVMTLFWVQDR